MRGVRCIHTHYTFPATRKVMSKCVSRVRTYWNIVTVGHSAVAYWLTRPNRFCIMSVDSLLITTFSWSSLSRTQEPSSKHSRLWRCLAAWLTLTASCLTLHLHRDSIHRNQPPTLDCIIRTRNHTICQRIKSWVTPPLFAARVTSRGDVNGSLWWHRRRIDNRGICLQESDFYELICHESEINAWVSVIRHNEDLVTCQFNMAAWPRGRLYVRQRRRNVSLLRVVAAFGVIVGNCVFTVAWARCE